MTEIPSFNSEQEIDLFGPPKELPEEIITERLLYAEDQLEKHRDDINEAELSLSRPEAISGRHKVTEQQLTTARAGVEYWQEKIKEINNRRQSA